MTTVWYIRHGESTANIGQATADPGAAPLTALGEEQAEKTSLAFSQPPDLIVTSSYRRAQQTAQPAASRFPQVPLETWEIHEFAYLSPGRIGMTTPQERKTLVRAYWDQCDPDYVHGEGAESFRAFFHRTQRMQKRISENGPRFIAVFSHGYVLKAALWANLTGSDEVTAETMRSFRAFHQTFDFPNCALLKAELRADALYFSGLITEHLR
jgi:broad specificity phosphatase PhoE